MKDLFRETVFGRLVRLASRGKLLAYDEESDPSILKRYQPVDSESSSVSPSLGADGGTTNQQNSKTLDVRKPTDTGQEKPNPVDRDQEQGADHLLVDWSSNDAHNPRNWSKPKKLFVTFQICLLTTSVYIGSAIYTAGLEGVEADFNVSPVKALLGLTLFVLGYALGPMVWVCLLSLLFDCPP